MCVRTVVNGVLQPPELQNNRLKLHTAQTSGDKVNTLNSPERFHYPEPGSILQRGLVLQGCSSGRVQGFPGSPQLDGNGGGGRTAAG